MGQSCTSPSFAGVRRRAQKREAKRVNAAILAAANPESDYWYDQLEFNGARLRSLLPEHIGLEELQECLLAWIDESSGKAVAEGYKRGADYLDDCQHKRTAPHLDTLLSRIRGKLYVANLDLTREQSWKDDPRNYKEREA